MSEADKYHLDFFPSFAVILKKPDYLTASGQFFPVKKRFSQHPVKHCLAGVGITTVNSGIQFIHVQVFPGLFINRIFIRIERRHFIKKRPDGFQVSIFYKYVFTPIIPYLQQIPELFTFIGKRRYHHNCDNTRQQSQQKPPAVQLNR